MHTLHFTICSCSVIYHFLGLLDAEKKDMILGDVSSSSPNDSDERLKTLISDTTIVMHLILDKIHEHVLL
jgi:hypothetical protein